MRLNPTVFVEGGTNCCGPLQSDITDEQYLCVNNENTTVRKLMLLLSGYYMRIRKW